MEILYIVVILFGCTILPFGHSEITSSTFSEKGLLNSKLTNAINTETRSNEGDWNPLIIDTKIQVTAKGNNDRVHTCDTTDTSGKPDPNVEAIPSIYVRYGEENIRANNKEIKNLINTVCHKIENIENRLEKPNCNCAISSDSKNEITHKICKSSVGLTRLPICEEILGQENKTKENIPKSCKEVQKNGHTKSGVYEIQPKTSPRPFNVLCDMDINGGGWTHIHRRVDGFENFFREWRDYKHGFGDLAKEFWMGNENIHHITGSEVTELLVEVVDRQKVKAHASYKAFEVGPEEDGYILKVLQGFSGDAGDALADHLGQKFSTKDVDQDSHGINCANDYMGAWWYKGCFLSCLNGKYINMNPSLAHRSHGMNWGTFRGDGDILSNARMLVRPANA